MSRETVNGCRGLRPRTPTCKQQGVRGTQSPDHKRKHRFKEIESRIKCSVRGNFLNENSNHNTWILNT